MRHWLLVVFFMMGAACTGLAAKSKSIAPEKSMDKAAETKISSETKTQQSSKSLKSQQAVSSKKIKKSKKTAKVSKNKKKKTAKKKVSKKARQASSKKKSKSTTKKSASHKSQKNDTKWNQACEDLLDTSVDSTLKLEKSLNRRKGKVSLEEFEGQVQNEMLVVQLNAWVCAISSQFEDIQKGASVEEEFLKDYAQRVQSRNL